MAGIHHVALRVRDAKRSRPFYENLGMQSIGVRTTSNAIDLGDGHPNLTLLPYDSGDRWPLAEGTEFIHLGFLVDDVAQIYSRLSELGYERVRDDVKLRNPPDRNRGPNGSFKVLYPDGNVVESATSLASGA